MPRLIVAAAVAALWAGAACAQMPAQMMFQNGADGVTALPVSPTRPLPTASTSPAIRGFGSLAVTNASVLASTLTLGVNSGAWPTTPGVVDVTNDPASADLLYICPLGGLCTTAVGIAVLPGQSFRLSFPAVTMTFIAASTATAKVQF